MDALSAFSLLPGFGFHPTDVELISHYLKRKILGMKIECDVIPEVEIYKHEPWDLPARCHVPTRDGKWHFFASRDKKYSNGSRLNRATKAGYWKLTGKDRKIKYQDRPIGTKKTLVFHEGRPPCGKRSDWIMHEYYISESECQAAPELKDSFVLCRITKRNGWTVDGENISTETENSPTQTENIDGSIIQPNDVAPMLVAPEISSQFKSVEDEDIEAMFTELFGPNFSAIPTLTEVNSEPKDEGLGSLALNHDPFDPHFLPIISEDSHLLFPVEEYYDILQSESQSFDVFGHLDIGSFCDQPGDIFADVINDDDDTGIRIRERGLKSSTSNLEQRKIKLKVCKMEARGGESLSQIVEIKKDFHLDLSDGTSKSNARDVNARKRSVNKSGLSCKGFMRRVCGFLASPCSSVGMTSFFLCACMMGTASLLYYFAATTTQL